jgi:hypothetical protein
MSIEIIKPDSYKPEIDVCGVWEIPYSHERRFVLRMQDWIIPILNFRYDTFRALRDDGRIGDNRIWLRIWTRITRELEPATIHYWACITDGRIPEDLYAKSLCWLGCELPPLDIAQEICAFAKQAGGLEQFTNPVDYWQKRGGVYKNGVVSFPG